MTTKLFSGCAALESRVPDAVVTDVDVGLLPSISERDRAAIRSEPMNQIIHAPAVNLTLYRALQAAQGISPADDSPLRVPNLTRGQLTALFAGNIVDWTAFKTNTGATFATGATAPPGFGGTLTRVFVCRRGERSPTQALFTSFFINERCDPRSQAFIAPTDIACLADGCRYDAATYGTDFVFAGRGTSDARRCLDDKEDLGVYAIGLLRTTTIVDSVTRRVRFVGIDGAAPTLSSVANGGYPFVGTSVINYRPGTLSAGLLQALFDYVQQNIGLPALIAELNFTYRNPGGDHGRLAIADGAGKIANLPPVTVTAMRHQSGQLAVTFRWR